MAEPRYLLALWDHEAECFAAECWSRSLLVLVRYGQGRGYDDPSMVVRRLEPGESVAVPEMPRCPSTP